MDKKIVVVWDAMLDFYIFGNTDRKNPESPMPLLKVEEQETKLWGASNVANNIASLNWSAELISLLWTDANWELFDRICEENNIKVHRLIMDGPTITKTRYLDSKYKQQLLRVDYQDKKEIRIEQVNRIASILNEIQPEIIVIADYNLWMVTSLCLDTIKNYAEENNIKILASIRPWHIELFKWVFLIKSDFKQFCEIMDNQWIEDTDEDITKYWLEFVKQYWTNLTITRWWKWSSLITKEWEVHHIPWEGQEISDIAWEWDTYIATLAYALSKWYPLIDSVKLANKASGIIIWKVWTACITKEELWI